MRARVIVRRTTATIADQVVSSASNFLVGVFVARMAGPEEFGAFALALTVWLTVAGVHRALVTDPLLIGGNAGAGSSDARVRSGIAAEVLLGVCGGIVASFIGGALLLAGARPLGEAALALAPWLVFLLVQDYWRWVAFMRGEPARALVNDVVYVTVQIAALSVLASAGYRTSGSAIVAWGLGAACGSLLGLRQFGLRPCLRGGRAYLRQAWPTGRWLLTDFGASYGATQAYLFVVAAVVGPVGLGALRAAQGLMGPTNIVVFGGSSIALPSAVTARDRSGWAGLHRVVLRTSILIGTAIAGCSVLVMALSPQLMGWVYGERFERFSSLLLLVALSYLVGGFGWGAVVGLKAGWSTRSLLRIRLVVSVASLAGVAVLGVGFGLTGVGWAGVLSSACYLVGAWVAYLHARRRGTVEGDVPVGEQSPPPADAARLPAPAAEGRAFGEAGIGAHP